MARKQRARTKTRNKAESRRSAPPLPAPVRIVQSPARALSGLLRALDAFVLALETGRFADEDLADTHGTKSDTVDLERDPETGKSYTRRPGNRGTKPSCSNMIIVEWRSHYYTDDSSRAALAMAVDTEIKKAKDAAAKLCTDPKCPDCLTEVVYSDVQAVANTKGQAAKGNHLWADDFVVNITLQLSVRCRLLV